MDSKSYLTTLVMALGTIYVPAAKARQPEAPKVTSWSNSKTGDQKTAFSVKPGDKITFTVKAPGAEKHQWLLDGKVQEHAGAASFQWIVPNRKGMWKILAKTTNDARRRWVKDRAALWDKWIVRDGDTSERFPEMKKRLIQDMVDVNTWCVKGQKEWVVSTFLTRVKPGDSVQKAIDSLRPEGGIVELANGVHDVRETIAIKRNNVAVCGTHDSVLRAVDFKTIFRVSNAPEKLPPVQSSAAWDKIPPVENVTFKGFKAASKWGREDRFKGRGAYLILVWKAKDLTVEDIHDASYMGRTVSLCPSGVSTRARNKNIHIRNITSEHGVILLADSDDVYVLNNTILGCPWNWGLYGDHGLANTHIVGNRVINGGANACLIVDVNPYWQVRDNLFQGTRGGIDISQGPSHVIIENNTIVGARDFGIMIKPQRPGVNVTIANNRIYGIGNWKGGTPYGHGIWATEYQNSSGESRVNIMNNTIYNCVGDGIHNSSGSAVIRKRRGPTPAPGHVALNVCNNIIANCKGYGINHSYEGGKTSLSHNNVWNNAKGNYNGCAAGKGDFSKDPLFADPANGDFHLKSKAGRWDPKSKKWVKDEVHSPCIDAGDPKADFSREPTPNGGRVNTGAYGNTNEASKSLKK